MPNDFTDEKKLAFEKYDKEHKQLVDAFCKIINKDSLREHSIGGVTLAIVIAVLFTTTHNTNIKHESNGQITGHKSNEASTTNQSVIWLIAACLASALAYTGIKTVADFKRNSNLANIFADKTFKKSLHQSLIAYASPDIVNSPDFTERAFRATALILNNIPEYKLFKLRTTAIQGLTKDENGYFKLNESKIEDIAKSIKAYLALNMELGVSVMHIMRGDEPLTYYLRNVMEKTK